MHLQDINKCNCKQCPRVSVTIVLLRRWKKYKTLVKAWLEIVHSYSKLKEWLKNKFTKPMPWRLQRKNLNSIVSNNISNYLKCWDSNQQPSKHEPPPITTRPELLGVCWSGYSCSKLVKTSILLFKLLFKMLNGQNKTYRRQTWLRLQFFCKTWKLPKQCVQIWQIFKSIWQNFEIFWQKNYAIGLLL